MADEFVPQWIIEKKRDGGALSEGEIREWIARYADGRLPDYQMAALAMAVYWRGMSADETLWLTDAMMRSGDTLSWSGLGRATADKHSTGGIGDKLSIPLAPLVAACGVAVPMISGRGLGITGGTLDKLESIPGYDTHLGNDRFREVVDEVGCSIIGQTDRLAPADRKLYALRDVSGTVPSIPLITAWSNDYGYDRVFMEQLDSLIDAGDVVFAFSGSGNSENVLKAVERANELGGITIGFSGYEGGKLAGMCKKSIVAKSDSMQRIEDIHLIVGHIIYAVIRDTYGTTGLC